MQPVAEIEASFQSLWDALAPSAGACVVAVSGGPDSVALLRLTASLVPRPLITAAHFDHAVRPDSPQDAEFVRALATELGVAFAQARWQRDSSDRGEAAARRARYQFLQEVAERCGARYLAVGHTADDQVETVLHRLVRGTGLRGLGGMQACRTLGPALTIVRPLLSVRRHALIAYLDALSQPYRRDPTNVDNRYTRNRIRHDLLPRLLHDYNPRIDAAILRLSDHAVAAQREIDRIARDWLEGCQPEIAIGYACIPVANWGRPSEFLAREMLALAWRQAGWPEQGMGYDEWRRLASMALESRPTTAIFPGEIVATRNRTQLILRGPTRLAPRS